MSYFYYGKSPIIQHLSFAPPLQSKICGKEITIEETNLADLPPKKENMALQTELQIKQTADRVA